MAADSDHWMKLRLESQSKTRRCSILLQLIPGGPQQDRLHSFAFSWHVCRRLCFFPGRLSCIFPAADMSGLFAMGATFMLGARISPDNKFPFSTSKERHCSHCSIEAAISSVAGIEAHVLKSQGIFTTMSRQSRRRRYKSALETLRRIRGKNDDVRWAFHNSLPIVTSFPPDFLQISSSFPPAFLQLSSSFPPAVTELQD